jgi:hypothetical protein
LLDVCAAVRPVLPGRIPRCPPGPRHTPAACLAPPYTQDYARDSVKTSQGWRQSPDLAAGCACRWPRADTDGNSASRAPGLMPTADSIGVANVRPDRIELNPTAASENTGAKKKAKKEGAPHRRVRQQPPPVAAG